MDAVDPLRRHFRVGGEEGRRLAGLCGVGVGIQDEDHPEQFPEGLVIQLCMMQPPALVRQLDRGQLADAGAVEAARVLARAARPAGGRFGPGHPQGGVAAQLADENQAPCVQPLDHRLAGMVAVAHEDVDVRAVPDRQGLVEQGQHRPHFGPRRPGAARPPAGTGSRRGLQAAVDGIRTVLVQVQDRQEPSCWPQATRPSPPCRRQPTPGRLAAALGDEGAVAGPGQIVRIRHHRAQPGQVSAAKSQGRAAWRPCVWGQRSPKRARLRWVGRTGRPASCGSRAARWFRCGLPRGRSASMVGSRSTGHLPGWRGCNTNTITGAVLPPSARQPHPPRPCQTQIYGGVCSNPARGVFISKTVHTIVPKRPGGKPETCVAWLPARNQADPAPTSSLSSKLRRVPCSAGVPGSNPGKHCRDRKCEFRQRESLVSRPALDVEHPACPRIEVGLTVTDVEQPCHIASHIDQHLFGIDVQVGVSIGGRHRRTETVSTSPNAVPRLGTQFRASCNRSGRLYVRA